MRRLSAPEGQDPRRAEEKWAIGRGWRLAAASQRGAVKADEHRPAEVVGAVVAANKCGRDTRTEPSLRRAGRPGRGGGLRRNRFQPTCQQRPEAGGTVSLRRRRCPGRSCSTRLAWGKAVPANASCSNCPEPQQRQPRVSCPAAAGAAATLLRCASKRGRAGSGRCTGRHTASRCPAGWCPCLPRGLTSTSARALRTSDHGIRS